jgi:hypothetical protein
MKTALTELIERLEKDREVDYQKMFANCKLPNEQPPKTVEERANELYPDKPTMDVQGLGKIQLAEYEREAYIKGASEDKEYTLSDIAELLMQSESLPASVLILEELLKDYHRQLLTKNK